MNTVSVIIAILAIGALVSYALPTQVFADESETNTEQKLAQENVGSGESTNFNCAENSIDAGFIDAQCGENNDPTIREICDDGIDNDRDGRVDETPCAVTGPFPD
jgi:hypothetical protein